MSKKSLPLDEYQIEAVELAIAEHVAAVFFDQGTGKTWVTGGVIERLLDENFAALLIVPLNNLETTWGDFLRKWFPGVTLLRSFNDFRKTRGPRIVLMHYEAIRGKVIQRLKRVKWTLICFDEAHRLGNRNSIQSRRAGQLRNSAEYKLLLTGTPFDEHLHDLWALFRFLKPELFGHKWGDFEEEYIEGYGWMKKKKRLKKSKAVEFLKIIRPYTIRVTRGDIGIPDPTYHEIKVPLRGEHRRLYDELELQSVTQYKGRRISSTMKATLIGKLHQVSGGYVKDDDGEIIEVGDTKMKACVKLVRSLEGPVIVFARYVEEVLSLHDELVDHFDRVEIIYGKTKKRERPQVFRDFQAGKIDVLVTQIRTGGVGNDLFRASKEVFYSFGHSRLDFEQAVARASRRGQQELVDVYLLLGENTVDMDIIDAIYRKVHVVNEAWKRLHRRRLRHGKEGKGKGRDREGDEGRGRAEVRDPGSRRKNGYRGRVRSRPVAPARHREGGRSLRLGLEG